MTTDHAHALLAAVAGEILSEPTRAALAEVARHIQRSSAVVVVVGCAGSGKTLLLECLEEKCRAEGMSVARIMPGRRAGTGRRAHVNVLLVDDADRLTDSSAKALIGTRYIERADTVVLACREGSARRFASRADAVIVQLRPLADYEARSYLLELAMSAGRPDLFTFDALSLLVDAAQGSVRLLRLAASLSLGCAFSAGSTQVSKEHVKAALAKPVTTSEMEEASVVAHDTRGVEAPAGSGAALSVTEERIASAATAPSETKEPAVVSPADARVVEAPADSGAVLSVTDERTAFAAIAQSEEREAAVVSPADAQVVEAPADSGAELRHPNEPVAFAPPAVSEGAAVRPAPLRSRPRRRRSLSGMPARLAPVASALPSKARFRRRAAVLASAAVATAVTTSLLMAVGAERGPLDVASLQSAPQSRDSRGAPQSAGSAAETGNTGADAVPASPTDEPLASPAAAEDRTERAQAGGTAQQPNLAEQRNTPSQGARNRVAQADVPDRAARLAQAARYRAEHANLAIEAARLAQAAKARAEAANVPRAAARPAPGARDVAAAGDHRRPQPQYRPATDAHEAELEGRRARDYERALAAAHEAELERHAEALRAYEDQLRAYEDRTARLEAAEAARAIFQILETRPSVLMRNDYFEVPPPFAVHPPPYAFQR